MAAPGTVTRDVAATLVELHLTPSADPTLTTAEVELLLNGAKRSDEEGLDPGETGWAESYDAAAAIAEGWRAKAARASRRVNLSRGGSRVDRGALAQACLRMAALWSRRTGAAVIPGATAAAAEDRGVEILTVHDEAAGSLESTGGTGWPGTDSWAEA